MRIVIALGGNALLERGERPDAQIEEHHIEVAATALAPICRVHDIVVTHGNGPQVGLLSLESDSDPTLSRGYPLDALGAQTQGMIGYWLTQALRNKVPDRSFAALVCQTIVDPKDGAFDTPTKFVGQLYSREQAERLAADRGWAVTRDGSGWRRVVPSPQPRELVELPAITALHSAGTGVVCCGGGGIPVTRDAAGSVHGVEAVIDKDRTAALLAQYLEADALIILTDVSAVARDFGTPAAAPLHWISVEEIRAYEFPDGSMGPKVESACAFVEATGRPAAIGRLEDAEEIIRGAAGTIVLPSAPD